MTEQILSIVKYLAKEINTYFGQRVISLVLFGSVLNRKEFNDIDLELLLDNPDDNDFLTLNKILLAVKVKVELHISYKNQLSLIREFRRKAQGSYLLYSLAKGKLLLGKENYYKRLLRITPLPVIKRDLMIKNQEYQSSLREFLLERDFMKKKNKFIKFLLRYIYQLMIIDNKLTYAQILGLDDIVLINKIIKSGLFSKVEIKAFLQILNQKHIIREELIKNCTLLLSATDRILLSHLEQIYG